MRMYSQTSSEPCSLNGIAQFTVVSVSVSSPGRCERRQTVNFAGFEVYNVMAANNTGYWAVEPCSLEKVRRFGGTDHICLQG
jgi:hypothetical protein